MTDVEALRSRAATYGLLARLWLLEPDEATCAALRRSTAFGPVLAGRPPAVAVPALRSEFARTLLIQLPAYEAVFTGETPALGGGAAEAVRAAYGAYGFAPAAALRVASPDHLGAELAFLQYLVEQEARRREHGDDGGARRLAAARRRFLAGHLAAWAPACCAALRRVAADPFYRALAEATAAWVLTEAGDDDHATQQDDADASTRWPLRPVAGGTAPEPGLPEVVRFLLTPARSGCYLTPGDLRAVGRRIGVAPGVTDRFAVLRDLFDAAGQAGRLEELLSVLRSIVQAWADTFVRWREAYGSGGAALARWTDRLAGTAAWLEETAAEARVQAATCGPVGESQRDHVLRGE